MTAGPGVTRRASAAPTLREERKLLRSGHLLVAGMDEVGRGALAGPVTVGVVVVDASVRTAPSGVRDSKLLAPAAREALVPRVRRWAVDSAVGHAEPAEIDRYGIIAALRLAGRRALARLDRPPGCVLLDGSHDWLSAPRPRSRPATSVPVSVAGSAGGCDGEGQGALFDVPVAPPLPVLPAGTFAVVPPSPLAWPAVPLRVPAPPVELPVDPCVVAQVKADLRCAAVAAASVLAKVERDAIMVERAGFDPRYGWHENKGYSAPEHAEAIRRHGPCEQHRRSWSLPVPSLEPSSG
jgi:ribonuclease HII